MKKSKMKQHTINAIAFNLITLSLLAIFNSKFFEYFKQIE